MRRKLEAHILISRKDVVINRYKNVIKVENYEK